MATPILSTKLHVPAPSQVLVQRARLTDQLAEGAHGRFVLVSAPAGFGKTTLLAEWAFLCREKVLVAWVHLDEGDNELGRFLRYLIAALQVHQEHLGEIALAGLGSMPPAPLETVLTSLLNELDALDRDLVLILDDYHLIDNASVHEAVSFLIEHLPEHVCLVIATRTDPPLPIHRLRARGQMVELRAVDLRFTKEETARFLSGQLEHSLSDQDINALDSRIEGWVAGLQMVALSLKGRQDIREFIDSFSGSHRFIMDYLTEEIYNRQPPSLQQFLLRTSVLDRLSGPLCDFVLGEALPGQDPQDDRPAAQQTLEELESANLFLLPLDGERVWYRYHPLFANLLRQRLRQTAPEEMEPLQRRASAWFAANGFGEEAFQYALQANDLQGAAQIVETKGPDLLKKGALSTISGWFSRLPDKIIAVRPGLNVLYAWVLLLTGQTNDLEPYLQTADEDQVPPGDADVLQGEIAAIRAYAAAMQGDVERTLEQADRALALLPSEDFSARSVVSFVLGGVHFLQGDLQRAFEAMREASQDGERSGNIHVAVSALSSMAGILMGQGRLKEAEDTYTRALELGTSRGGQPLPITAGIYAGVGRLHLARQDIPKARKFAQTGVELGERWMNADSQVGSLLTLAQIAQLEGNIKEAEQALRQARQLSATHILTPGTAESIAVVENRIQGQKAGRPYQGMLLEPLSERELEVLRLIAEGCSNQEIASKLIVALGTVKAHTSAIYRKLDVRGRMEAVIKAGELGLL